MMHYLYSFLLVLLFLGLCQLTKRRWALWGGLVMLIGCVHFFHLNDLPFARMVVICSVMLIGMKGIVLVEWGGKLTLWRWFVFVFLWFGMEPTPFAAAKRKLTWRKDAVVGFTCFIAGLFGSIAVAHMHDAPLWLMFVSLSIAFHFGLLRLLTAFWRMKGIAVRPLFRNPLTSRGLGNFWSKRWNLSFSQMMARTVQRPMTKIFGQRAALFAVFLISGLFHEVAITLPVNSGYGLPTLYFFIHGLVVLLEGNSWPSWLKRVVAALLILVPLPLLFPEQFTHDVIIFTLNHLIIY